MISRLSILLNYQYIEISIFSRFYKNKNKVTNIKFFYTLVYIYI